MNDEVRQKIARYALVVLLFAPVLVWNAKAAPDREMLHGHVPSAVAGLTPVGGLPATNHLILAIGLPMRNEAGLDELLRQLYDPHSASFHKFLTLPEFTARFGPTEQDYESVKQFARANGLTVAGAHPSGFVLNVEGSVSNVEQAFHIRLHAYKHPTEERDFFAPDTEPSVPANMPVIDVQGLSDYSRPHPKLQKRDATVVAPKVGSAPDGSGDYFGNDYRNAYAPGVTLTGAGQNIGLVEFDGFYSKDIAAYAKAAGNGRTNIVIQTILLDGYNGTPTTGRNSGNPEVSLDIEMGMAMAPGLSTIISFEAGPYGLPNDVLNAMLTCSSSVKQLSCSWGWSGGPTNTTDTIFKSMQAVGQTFLNASGDSDAFTTGAGSVNGVDNPAVDNSPSSSPYITVVGGTKLTMNGAGASYASETVWNQGGGVGSSGGVSSYYAIPDWQTNISNMAGRGGSTSFRNIPDVAMNAAEDSYIIYGGNGQGSDGWGGTSFAAPLWAGFMALVNQQAAAAGNPPAGFINPVIYGIAAGTNYASCFHDTTTGNNTSRNSPNLFYATSGYDLCTGLGSPTGTNLINALALPGIPYFITQPASQTVTNGASVTFNTTVVGQPPLSYQWLFNSSNLAADGNISGALSNVLSIAAATTNDSGNYSLIAANSYGSITSSVAALNVVLPPTIASSSLTNVTVQCGANSITFSITASGTAPLSVQWSLDGLPVTGATNSSLSLANLHLPNHAVSVTVTNFYGSVTSNVVVTVIDTEPPIISLNGANPLYVQLDSVFVDPGATANDLCAGAIPVGVSGSVNPNALGTNALTYTADDGNGNTSVALRTVIVQNTQPPDVLWSFTNLVLAAGMNCNATMPDATGTNYIVAANLPGDGPLTISQMPTNGAILSLGTNVVVLAVADLSGNTSYSTNTIVVLDETPPAITLNGVNPLYVQLDSAFVDPGATANDFCAGAVPVSVSGSVNTGALGTNTLTYTADDGNGNTNTALRTVIVQNTQPPTVLWSFTNLVLAAGTNCNATMPDATGTNYIVAANLPGDGPLTISQMPTNGTILPLGTNVVVLAVRDLSGNTSYSTNTIVVLDETPPVISIQPQSQSNLVGSTAVFSVGASACTPLAFQWYFNNAALATQTNATLTLSNLTLGVAGNYFAVATASGGSSTSSVATLTVVLPPVISIQPQSLTNLVGSTAVFSIQATGTAPIIYSWSKDGVLLNDGASIIGSASNVLRLLSVTGTNAGEYAVLVSNPGGNVLSSNAALLLNGRPQITTAVLAHTNLAGTANTFSVKATGTSPLRYGWQFGGVNVPGATNSSYAVSNLLASQAGFYGVIVSNIAGMAASSNYLTVLPDTIPPTVAITVPVANSNLNNNILTATGTATDNAQVTNVAWSLNGGGFVSAQTTNSWKNWSANLNGFLTPGTNTLIAQAHDFSGNASVISASTKRTFFYAVPSVLTVITNGVGTLSTNLGGQTLLAGWNYAVTALPGPGQFFSHWLVGDTTVSNAALTFMMQPNLVLQADFIPSPFNSNVTGNYYGLFYQTNEVDFSSAGFLSLTVNSNGVLGGKIYLGGTSFAIPSGVNFNLTGQAAATVSRSAVHLPNLTLDLQLDLTGQDLISGSIASADNAWTSSAIADRAIFSAANLTPNAGKYTFVIPGTNNRVPAGNGYALVTVATNGPVTLSGYLGDGLADVQTAGTVSISKDGAWPLYMSLYSGSGLLIGWVNITNSTITGTNLSGLVFWTKQANPTNVFYPAGFTNEIELLGSGFVAPASGHFILAEPVTNFIIAGGDLAAPITNSVTLTSANKITVGAPNSDKLAVTLTTTSGLISGSFVDPVTGLTNTFKGAVLQQQNIGAGQFTNSVTGGSVLLK